MWLTWLVPNSSKATQNASHCNGDFHLFQHSPIQVPCCRALLARYFKTTYVASWTKHSDKPLSSRLFIPRFSLKHRIHIYSIFYYNYTWDIINKRTDELTKLLNHKDLEYSILISTLLIQTELFTCVLLPTHLTHTNHVIQNTAKMLVQGLCINLLWPTLWF